MRLTGKAALITGGSSGIGRATACSFAREGARVSIAARDEVRGRGVVSEIATDGGEAIFVPCDVTRAADCQSAVSRTLEVYGRLDILFNSAGMLLRERTILSTTEAEWDAIMAVNVKGAFLMSKAVLPTMLQQCSGVIIHNASCFGLVGGKGLAAYCASKGALVLLTKAMALDHAAQGIRVNCLCAGSVETRMIRDAIAATQDPEATRQLFLERHPLGRLATPEEIATAALYLASDDAVFMTGASLVIDGGVTAS